MITDQQRIEFLQKLGAEVRGKNGIMLTEWESQFLGSFLQCHPPAVWFTIGRRPSVDKLWMRYGAEINWPHPKDRVAERPKIPQADATGCEYLVREDGRQRRCNDPAEFQEPGRLRYCRMHAEAVERDLKRAGKNISLIKFP
jgi:hypothetical protein